MGEAAVVTLRVAAGLHRGARVPLAAGRWRIGATLEHDIVLHDAAAPLRLEVEPGGVNVWAEGEGWSRDGTALPAGAATAWREPRPWRRSGPLTMKQGALQIELSWPRAEARRPFASWSIAQLSWATAAVMAAAATVAIGTSVVAPRAPSAAVAAEPLLQLERRLVTQPEWRRVTLVHRAAHDGREHPELRGRVDRRDELERLVRMPEVAAVAPVVRVVVESELRRQVQNAVDDPAVQVAIEEGGDAAQKLRLIVSGSTRRAGVAAALKFLNIELGERVEIVDRTVYAPDERDRKTVRVELPIRIAAVNASERYIESTEGARYFEGSVVSGYTVEAIEARKVVFKVGDKRIEYPVP